MSPVGEAGGGGEEGDDKGRVLDMSIISGGLLRRIDCSCCGDTHRENIERCIFAKVTKLPR